MTDETTIAAEAARDAQNLHEKRRGWGCFVYAAGAVLVPLLVLTLAWMLLAIADRQLAAEAQQRARAAGDPLTAAEMRAFYSSTPESEAATAKWMATLRATEAIGIGPSTKGVPVIGNVKATLDERGLYDAATLARAEPFLEGPAAEALKRAHESRDRALDVRFPIAFERGYDGRIEPIQHLRSIANLLSIEAEVHAARGEPTQATESLLTLIAASETVAEVPEPIGYLVRIAILGVAARTATDLIDRAEFPPDDLRQLQEAFARQGFHRQMLRAIQGDQYQALQFCLSGETAEYGPEDQLRWLPLRGEDQAMMLDLRREFLDGAASGFPEADRAAASVEAKFAEIKTSGIVDQFRYALALETEFLPAAFVNAGLRAEAQTRMCAACCACERYRQAHGEWPPALETLVPEYLPEVPLDPVDGRPLRCEVDGERMILHSIAHFRPENQLVDSKLGDGLVSYMFGEKYEPEPMKADVPEILE